MAYKIFIDQGHNPVNPNAGAEFAGVREQDVNFDVGIRLAGLLESNPLFDVRLSRLLPTDQLGTDNTSSIRARTDAANNWGADFFISLHCNTNSSTEISGTEAYVYRLDSAGSRMATQLVRGIHQVTGLRNRGVFARPSLAVFALDVHASGSGGNGVSDPYNRPQPAGLLPTAFRSGDVRRHHPVFRQPARHLYSLKRSCTGRGPVL